jgi:mono/diheme cytochrome c family protein
MKMTKVIFLPMLFLGLLVACTSIDFEEPRISLEAYHIEEGFELEVLASEPLLEAPVTLDFDNQGRMWVAEMRGYMQDLEGTGEHDPNGRIVILEDIDKDGVADHAKVFLDSLVLPRALAHVYGGLLYAEPPNLWFVSIEDDKPGNKILVDSLYSEGGNVEHQPNGLMMNIDNWIYNAKSNFRYQLKNGKWRKEPTTYRGQWGISKDNFGRLYYNTNSTQLIGDEVLPNTTINNPYFNPQETLHNVLTPDQRVYPLHATSVNRGYQKGVLDKDSILVNVTSSCGPLIYRGDQFPEAFAENAFVCVPEANLIKRNILNFDGIKITGKQAREQVEFLAATEEGFRPVNIFNGPDGALYIVDMHRGIIQDKAYLSPYLKNKMAREQLDTIKGMGRILRVKNKNKDLGKIPDFEGMKVEKLVGLLESPNGWIRDRAQQLLIFRDIQSGVPMLEKLGSESDNPIARLHAIHTLNGLNALEFEYLENLVNDVRAQASVVSHTLVLMEDFTSESHIKTMRALTENLMQRKDSEIDLYLAASLGKWLNLSYETFVPVINKLAETYATNPLVQEAIINSVRGHESDFMEELGIDLRDEDKDFLVKNLLKTLANKENNAKNAIFVQTRVNTDSRTAGHKIYSALCAICHGVDGNGIQRVAPPLRGSEYVEGLTERLALIILHGLHGPIHVKGKRYEFNAAMPGLANNSSYDDRDIANVISYLHNAFATGAEGITLEKIKSLRDQKPEGGSLFTEEELNSLFQK